MTKKPIVLWAFIALKFILQVVVLSPAYDLQRDEYLHLDQANHLAWGYLSVPPFTSWTSSIILLLGNSVFWVKFFPALYGALTLYLVWKAIEELNGNFFALVLGATCVLFSTLLRLNTLYQPNSFDVLSWTALYFVLIKFCKTQDTKWFFVAAVVFAVGFLNKYNLVFLLIGLVPALLLTEQRKIFAQPKFYLALAAGFLLILPNLWWQYQNDFPVFHHLKVLSERQLVNVNRMDFLRGQILFFIGSLVVIISSLYALLRYEPFKPYRFYFWALFFTLAAFTYFKAKNYYAIGIYPIYIAFGAVYLGDVLQHGWKRYLRPVLVAIPVLFFIPMFDIAFPNKSPDYIIRHAESYKSLGLLRWEDGKDHLLPQDYADMLGWKELASKVDSLYSALPKGTTTLVLCDNYGQAGAINYYTNYGVRAVSFNADYINWFDLTKKFDNLIRIKEKADPQEELQETSPIFEHASVAASITNPYAREFGTTIFLFTGAKIDVRDKIKAEIAEEKNFQ
ncbi:MAG: glycosyltransferase family 39 protein [Bacteroidetes bacterium]|nr:glycosyltransferase family 39 protein [Bacteroidota bacterium]